MNREHSESGALDARGWSDVTALRMARYAQLAYAEPHEIFASALVAGAKDVIPFTAENEAGLIVDYGTSAVLAIRGTDDAQDWIRNLNYRQKPLPGFGHVHRGFDIGWQSILDRITPILASLTTRRLWITGHSRGGSLALRALADLRATFDIGQVHAFEPARVFDDAAAETIDRLHWREVFTYTNGADVVPRVPPRYIWHWRRPRLLRYEHVGRRVHATVTGTVLLQPTRLKLLADRLMAYAAWRTKPGLASIANHDIELWIRQLERMVR